MSAPPELGILIVHGIGRQKQGETLNEIATPIIKWLDQWLAPDTREVPIAPGLGARTPTKALQGRATFTRALLRPPDLPIDAPAHAFATISYEPTSPPSSPLVSKTWLFAEGWWSPQTLEPRVSPFLLWLITRGPWLMLMHLSQRFGVDPQVLFAQLDRNDKSVSAILHFVRFLAVTGIWLASSLLLLLSWCVVSLVALIPIGFIRQRVYGVLIDITGVVGDSYVLINDPIQRAAFAGSVRNALEWLNAQQCGKLVVIAHSQGAAIAYDVLFRDGARHVNQLVTLGPGIAKLHALADREHSEPQTFMWSGAAAPLTFAAMLLLARFWLDGEEGIRLWGGPAFIGVLALVAVDRSWKTVGASLEALKPDALSVMLRRQWQPYLRWHDFYASRDPVSNGSLSSTIGAKVRRIVSRRVVVMQSMLADHTAYWTSRADFVPHVLRVLDRCAGTGLRPHVRRVREGRRVFRAGVRLLALSRLLGYVALLLPLYAWTSVRGAADSLHATLAAVPVASVSGFVNALDTICGWLASLALGRDLPGAPVAAMLWLAVIAATALTVWGRIVQYWWQHLATTLMTPVFEPSRADGVHRVARQLLAGLVAILALLPLVLSTTWTFYPQVATWDVFKELMARSATFLVMLGCLSLVPAVAAGVRDAVRDVRRRRAAAQSWAAIARASRGDWGALGAAVFVVGVLNYFAVTSRYGADVGPPAVVTTAAFLGVRFVLRRWWPAARWPI